MKNSFRFGFAFALTALTQLPVLAGNWPAWRGPDGTGAATEKDLPLKWGPNENVRWRVELPGPGNSSPIVWGDRVFVTQALAKENRRTLMCFDRATGKSLWQSGVTYSESEPTQENNPYCAGTPATDGKLVYVCFGSAGVYAYDFAGKEVWHRDLGKLSHMFGNAISPILYEDRCILNFGPDKKTRLVALNKKTGEIVWEATPPPVDESERQTRMPGGGGGFGPGMFVGPQILAQADKNGDQKLSKAELTDLVDAWFDKLDSNKTGKLGMDEFVEKLTEVLPPPPGAGPPGGPGGGDGPRPAGGRGAFSPSRAVGPGLFAAADADKDGSLTRDELKATFAKWFVEWDKDKTGTLDEAKLRDGLNAALPRPGGPGGPGGGRGMGAGGGDPSGSWSTPVVIRTGGHDELVISFQNRLVAYDPKSGKQLWINKGLGGTVYTSPLWGDGTVVAMSSGMGGGSAIAVKPGESTEGQQLWRLDRVKSAIGTGVVSDGRLFTIGQDGVAECLDLKTGAKIWDERLKGSGSRNGSWSSMLLADGKIYVPNQSGDVFVFRAGPKFEELGSNSVNEPTNASLAASDGDLFLRTDKSLWCFTGKK